MTFRKLLTIPCITVVLLLVLPAIGSNVGDGPPVAPAEAIPTDGPLLYKVEFLGITCGHMVLESRLEAREGRELVHIIMTAWNSKFFNRIYRVDARIDSWVDPNTLTSIVYESATTEKGETEVQRYSVDVENAMITSEEDGETTTESYDGGPVLDPLAFVFALRGIAGRPGEDVSLRLFTSDGPLDTSAVVGALEKRRTYLGRIPLLKVQPAPESGSMFSRKGEMAIWIEPGSERTMHRLDFKLSFGRLIADLKGPAAEGASRGNLHGKKTESGG